ncbi:MAG TPA: glutamate racemase [Candidatus Saccharimonadales bacterium]|nr:glutamate racemase [Candidatus Saccharimonadales bacterium]
MPQKIGVFDSGVGGLAVIAAIKKELPNVEIIFKSDKAHFPYGTRSIDNIYGFVKPIFDGLASEGCQVIVVACNTVTTNLIERLRAELKIPLIGIEPMVKPAAAATKTGAIAVFATPRTLASTRYSWLKEQYAKGVKVIEPDCSDWAYLIENRQIDRSKIEAIVNGVCAQGADQLVLGCTHYHWIEELIREIAVGRAEILQPEVPVVDTLKTALAQLS